MAKPSGILAHDPFAAVVVAVGHIQPPSQIGRSETYRERGAGRPQDDPVQAVELPVQPVGPVLQLPAGHPRRPDHRVAEVVVTPVAVDDPAGPLELVIQHRARLGRQDRQLQGVDTSLLEEPQRPLEDARVVAVEADDDARLHANAFARIAAIRRK